MLISRRLSTAFLAILAWSVLWAAYFAPVLPRNKVLAPLDILESLERPWSSTDRINVWNAFCYDAISQYIPYDYSVYQSIRDDGFIGWNPNTHNGTAIRENHMLCPSSLRHVFYRFLPFWDAWDWGRMVHFLLAGIGMILLLAEVCLSPTAALLGAVAFAFSSQMVVWIHSDVIASGCCWSPWMIWSLVRLRRVAAHAAMQPRSGRLAVLAAALPAGMLAGAALRCGFLHTTLFNLSLLLLFIACEMVPSRDGPHPPRWPFLFVALLALALAAPWLATVVPPALHGGHTLRPQPILAGIKSTPTLVAALVPTIFGTPQGLDAFKAFGGDFYEAKFVGGTVLSLALLAAFRRDSPRFPKLLFLVFLILPFTPLSKWYYHRCFVLSALGAAWLAAWQLDWQSRNDPSPVWRRILAVFVAALALWLSASVVLQLLEPSLLPKLQAMATERLSPGKAGRAEWMIRRTARFYSESKIWSPRTFTCVLALGTGLFAASRIAAQRRLNGLATAVVLVATFAELVLFGTRIFRPCDRPTPMDDSPYPDHEWVARFKSHLGNGSVVFWQPASKDGRADFDYMQINAPSAHGIRQAEGYESVQPVRLAPRDRNAFVPSDFARAGISHVSTPHGKPFPNAEAWHLVESSPDYDLYENPAFHSIFLATLADGAEIPLFANVATPNSLCLSLPGGTASIRLTMTHHPGWRYRLGNGPWTPVPSSSDGLSACEITFHAPLPSSDSLSLRFRR